MTSSSYELQILFCVVLLGLVQLVLATLASVGSRGLPWGTGPRDEGRPPIKNKYGARLERAYQNFLETFPFFAAAVLLVFAWGRSSHESVLGAQIYIWARLLYVPAYVLAIPFTRTLIWAASLAGIVVMLLAVWP
ncbi:MAG TPA: MAPEG family protein [Rhizomicrobium sp.]|nr:MAPEG family protein [Rhizomicrobium sp.]